MRAAASLPLSPRTYTATPGLSRQVGLAPPHDVVLERARAPVVDHSAVLERNAAAVREKVLVELAQAVGSPVNVCASGGLARVAVGLERRHDRVDVAGSERALILADDV